MSMDTADLVQADYLRFWIEEALELGLTKSAKYDLLNDCNDQVEQIHKAYRLCHNPSQLLNLNAKVE